MTQFVVLGVALAVLALFVAIYASARFRRVLPNQFTFIIVDDSGFEGVMDRSGVLWNPRRRILQGPNAPEIAYTTQRMDGSSVRRVLLDRRTGQVSLRVQSYSTNFVVETSAGRKLLVRINATFKIDPNDLKEIIAIEDFGSVLRSRFQSIFREEIAQKTHPEILENMAAIRTSALEKLAHREERRQLLGVDVTDVKFDVERLAALPPTRLPGDKEDAAAEEAVDEAVQHYPALQPQGETLLQDPVTDVLRRLESALSNANPAVLSPLLMIMEMETRRKIAASLAQAQGLIVVSPQELGLTPGEILEEPLRKHFVDRRRDEGEPDGGT